MLGIVEELSTDIGMTFGVQKLCRTRYHVQGTNIERKNRPNFESLLKTHHFNSQMPGATKEFNADQFLLQKWVHTGII